jgi:hypothetical protein
MAGPFDLTGQNIENTYQRVLQTPDGVNVYDGTGSAFIFTAVAVPEGPNTSVQFNGNGLFSGSSNFTFNSASNALTLTGSLNITGSTTQTGNNTLTGNTLLSGSIIISGSQGPGSPTASVQIYGDIKQSGYHRFDPVTTNIDTSLSASYIYVSGSTNDLYFSQNGAGYNNVTRLRWLEGNLYTGLLHGGAMTQVNSNTYQVASGSGIIVNLNASIPNDPYPTIQFLNWGNLTKTIDALSASYDQQFIAISSSGQIHSQGTPYFNGEVDRYIPVGIVLHQNRSSINGTKTQPSLAYGWKQRSNVFISAFGPLKLSGHALATSSSRGLTVGSGTSFSDGANYPTDPNNPSYVTDPGTNVSKIFRYRQSGSNWVYDTNGGVGYTVIDPTQYSLNGTLTGVANNRWSIQRVFWYPNSVSKAIVVYYGNAVYSTESEAIANINIETFGEAPNTAANAIYVGAIIIKGDGTFAVDTDFTILPGGLFRGVGGGGGGGGTTIPGGSDTQIQYNNNNTFGGVPVLTYNGTTLSATGSFSGSFTGAFTGSLLGTSTTASYYQETDPIFIAKSASLATTGSNIFIGDQTITGSLIVNDGTYDIVNTTAFSLADNASSQSINWNDRALYANDGITSHLNWSNPSYMQLGGTTESPIVNILGIDGGGRIYYTASSAIGGGTNTPTFPHTGSAIISGSLVVTGSTTSTLGFTGSLFGTSSWATRAITASFLQNDNPNGLTLSVIKGITLQATDTSVGFVNLQAKNIELTGSTGTTITAYGNILPGGPYTNNTSSFNLGSPTAAWKDLYVSNGSVTFISGSNQASIKLDNNNNIIFTGASVTLPTSSTITTAQTASFLSTATTVGQNLITLPNPTAIRYLKINADNSVTTLTAAQLRNDLGQYRATLASDVSITAANTTVVDITGLSFPITAGRKYKFKATLLYGASSGTQGLRIGINADVSANAVYYMTTQVSNNTPAATSFVSFNAVAFNSLSANAIANLTNGIAFIEGYIDANNTGTVIGRFSKGANNSGSLTIRSGSFIDYEEFL